MHGGCDQGFCLNYGKLSYRRKLIRTFWLSAVGILFAAAMLATRPDARTNFTYICLTLLILIAVAQAIYNYRRWKAESR